MAVEQGRRCSGRCGRRRAGGLPVLRWLQVGAAAAGVGVALVAVPGTAAADNDTDSSGVGSSHGSGPAATSAPGADVGSASGDTDDSSEDVSSTPGGRTSAATVDEGAPETTQDESDEPATAITSDTDLTPGGDYSEEPEQEESEELDSSSLDPPDSQAGDDPATSADTDTDTAGDGTVSQTVQGPRFVSADGRQDPPVGAADETNDSSPDDSVASTSAPAAPDSTDGQAIAADTGNSQPPSSVAFAQSTGSASVAVAHSTSQPEYPAPVNAPVTWRSILTESLSWFGWGALATNSPVPQFPVPDLIAGTWIGLRRLHYTFFNSAPRLQPSAYTADPGTGVITGNLGGFDPDGDVITYTVTGAPENGIVQIAEDGTYTYTPGNEFAATGGTDTFTVVADDTGAANRWHLPAEMSLNGGLSKLLTRLGLAAPQNASAATVNLTGNPVFCNAGDDGCASTPADPAPSVNVHNKSDQTIWVYNLPTSGDYSIGANFQPVSVSPGASAPVGLVVGTGALGTPENRIYIVEGDAGFNLPVVSSSGIDAFNPTAVTADNSFLNYNFLEYFLYPADGGYEYTIDTSYIDEWSLPIQFKFSLNGADWSGAVDGKTYGFSDYDTVVNQLTAAGGPYQDLVWSGSTPWTPQPPSTVSRIIGPDKVWTAQSLQPPSNINMDNVGWVPTSYQDFVQFGATTQPDQAVVYPYAYNGNEYSSTENNFDFWRYETDAPAGTPYPIALRTAAILDKFPAVDGVYGFFTYPNDEAAGQFTNIPTAVSLDIYVHGSSDGLSYSVIEGGQWLYSSSPSETDRTLGKLGRDLMIGSDATDTFILDSLFPSRRATPLVIANEQEHDIIVIDKTALAGATSFDVEVVDCLWFLGGGFANYDSQFVYERSTGYLYYDEDPHQFGYTGVLAKLRPRSIDPDETLFVL